MSPSIKIPGAPGNPRTTVPVPRTPKSSRVTLNQGTPIRHYAPSCTDLEAEHRRQRHHQKFWLRHPFFADDAMMMDDDDDDGHHHHHRNINLFTNSQKRRSCQLSRSSGIAARIRVS